jgi:predicted transcriptional regulator
VGKASAVTSELDRLLMAAGLAAAVPAGPTEAKIAVKATDTIATRTVRRRTKLADMK